MDITPHLHYTYGSFWKSKVTIVLLCGHAELVEQVAPGLSRQRWLEADGRLLLWGGEQFDSMDDELMHAVKKLRRRPLDALVWVTDAWQQPDSLLIPEPAAGLDDEQLARIRRGVRACFKALGWSAPLYVWSLHGTGEPADTLANCLLPEQVNEQELEQRLQALQPALIEHGTHRALEHPAHTFLLALAGFLSRGGQQQVSRSLGGLLQGAQAVPLAGVLFSVGAAQARTDSSHILRADARWTEFFNNRAQLPHGLQPRSLGWYRPALVQAVLLGLAVVWAAGMLVSYGSNRQQVMASSEQLAQVQDQQRTLQERLQAMARLQQHIGRLQYQQDGYIPLWQRFGLNQHDALLQTLWPAYRDQALLLLRDPLARQLSTQLAALAASAPDSAARQALIQPSYETLKAYLMLSREGRMNAEPFVQTAMAAWPSPDGISAAAWQSLGPELLWFYAEQLPRHADWLLKEDNQLVAQARALLVRDMGNRNTDSALMEQIIEQVSPQYADIWLADLVGHTDAGSLLVSELSIPGVYTRQAWEGAVRPAIEQKAKQYSAGLDWVLTDTNSDIDEAPETLQQRLSALYFAGFSRHWQRFLNNVRWRHTDNLADSVEQLTLMADVRQSPLFALMNSLAWQAGAGLDESGFADTLVYSARKLLTREQQPEQSAPLTPLFGPLLAILEPGTADAGAGHLSFQRYLTQVTRVRLKLQQVLNAPDPQALSQTLAQSVFQGRSSDLADTQDYANLLAASLGQELDGFAQALLVQPLEQAWQHLLTPTLENLNRQWQRAVVDDWRTAFGGRYPLQPTLADSSLPLYASYIQSDNGRISQFLNRELQGVLRKEGTGWVAQDNVASGMRLNPEFLQALGALGTLSDVLFTRGDARVQFELRPETAAGVMQMRLTIDGQTLDYRNEMPRWQRFTWPADTLATGAQLAWRSEQTGLRMYADFSGSWGLIRLLEQAEVSDYPGLPSSYRIRWSAPDGHVLSFIMRTELGQGPLALLQLRGFALPQQVFLN